MPQQILDLLDDDMWLYGYAQLDDTTVFIGTARGSDHNPAYRCTAELFRLDLTNGSRTKIANAIDPTLAPDQRKIAFAERSSSPTTAVCGLDVVTVLDLETNASQSGPPVGPNAEPAAAYALRWSPDSSKLRFYIGYEHSGGVSGPLIYDPSDNTVARARIDTATGRTLSDIYAPTMPPESWYIWIGVWLAPNVLAVRVGCGLGCLGELPRDQYPGWYPLAGDGVLRTLDHRITDPTALDALDRCVGLSYC